MVLQAIKDCLLPVYVSNRTADENGWRFFNRSSGDVYRGDSDSLLRFKFFMHAIYFIPTAAIRWAPKVIWFLSQMSTYNGYKMGQHRWKIHSVRRYMEKPDDFKAGTATKVFIIIGSIAEQNAKDIAKIVTYPVLIIVQFTTSCAGMAFPLTARRLQAHSDWIWMMETKHGVDYGKEQGAAHGWKQLLAPGICGAGFATPCMRTWKQTLEVNGIGWNEGSSDLSYLHNRLRIFKTYFIKSNDEELANWHHDAKSLLKLYPLAKQLQYYMPKEDATQNWLVDPLKSAFSNLASLVADYIESVETQASIKDGKTISNATIKELAQQNITHINEILLHISGALGSETKDLKNALATGNYKEIEEIFYDLLIQKRREARRALAESRH